MKYSHLNVVEGNVDFFADKFFPQEFSRFEHVWNVVQWSRSKRGEKARAVETILTRNLGHGNSKLLNLHNLINDVAHLAAGLSPLSSVGATASTLGGLTEARKHFL